MNLSYMNASTTTPVPNSTISSFLPSILPSSMTDVGEYTDQDFAEIWEQMRVAEQQTDQINQRLDALHANLDNIITEFEPQAGKEDPNPTAK